MVEIEAVQKVLTLSQDYIILGKQTKETEIKIYVHGEDYEKSRRKIENMVRLANYAVMVNTGKIALGNYKPEEEEKKDG